MPPRTFSLELSRTSYVCQSCLTTLRGSTSSVQPWITRRASSSNVTRRPPPRATTIKALKDARESSNDANFHEIIARIQNGEAPDEKELAQLEAEIDKNNHEISEAQQKNEQMGVRYYDQDPSGQLTQLRDNEEFSDAASGLDAEVEKHISQLEQHMLKMIRMFKDLEKEGMPERASELRKQFKHSLRTQYKGKTGPEDEVYGMLRIPGFSGPKARPVAYLNTFLARDSVVQGGIPKQKDLVECWKYYSAARKTLSTAWKNVPREVWDFLWMILSWDGTGVENPNRMRHIYVLAKDMNSAGVLLKDSQQLLAIEAMFIEGWEEEAIMAWKKAVVTLGSKPETFENYWELGVRMLARRGDTERAMRAAHTLLKSAEQFEPRILIPIIRALSARDDTAEQAWETYREMKELLSDDMTIEDYDEVIAIFLSNNRVESALQAFVDMMFSSPLDIRSRTKLPMAVSNQFFVGKWLKRLIGAGDLDGAYKVVEYLQRKGITPSPIQLNGLLGAWIRSQDAGNVEKAEKLAWDMINSRLSYVDARDRQSSFDQKVVFYDPVRRERSVDEDGPGFHCATKATAETFSVLAENYCARGLHSRLQLLWKASQESGIGTTSFLMNQLIRSFSQNGQADEAIRLYTEMVLEGNVKPDAHTFSAIFNTLSVNRLITRDEQLARRDVTLGRQFFSDMVRADWTFDGPELFHMLPRLILFSMLKCGDYPGMMVAARAMAQLFDFAPPEPLLIELATGTETLRVKTKRNITRILEGTRTIDTLMKKHGALLIEQGCDLQNITEEWKADQRRGVLESLILIKAGAEDARPEEVKPVIEETAQEMGVYDIVTIKDPAVIARHRKIIGHAKGSKS